MTVMQYKLKCRTYKITLTIYYRSQLQFTEGIFFASTTQTVLPCQLVGHNILQNTSCSIVNAQATNLAQILCRRNNISSCLD